MFINNNNHIPDQAAGGELTTRFHKATHPAIFFGTTNRLVATADFSGLLPVVFYGGLLLALRTSRLRRSSAVTF